LYVLIFPHNILVINFQINTTKGGPESVVGMQSLQL